MKKIIIPILLVLPLLYAAGESPKPEFSTSYEFGWNNYDLDEINEGLENAGVGSIDPMMLFSHGYTWRYAYGNFVTGLSYSRSGNRSLPFPESGDRRVRWYQDAVYVGFGTGFSSKAVFGSLTLDLGYLRSVLQFYPTGRPDYINGLDDIGSAGELTGFGWAAGLSGTLGLAVLKPFGKITIPISLRGQAAYSFPRTWKLFDDQELSSHPQTGPLHFLVGLQVGIR